MPEHNIKEKSQITLQTTTFALELARGLRQMAQTLKLADPNQTSQGVLID